MDLFSTHTGLGFLVYASAAFLAALALMGLIVACALSRAPGVTRVCCAIVGGVLLAVLVLEPVLVWFSGRSLGEQYGAPVVLPSLVLGAHWSAGLVVALAALVVALALWVNLWLLSEREAPQPSGNP